MFRGSGHSAPRVPRSTQRQHEQHVNAWSWLCSSIKLYLQREKRAEDPDLGRSLATSGLVGLNMPSETQKNQMGVASGKSAIRGSVAIFSFLNFTRSRCYLHCVNRKMGAFGVLVNELRAVGCSDNSFLIWILPKSNHKLQNVLCFHKE